MKASTPSNRKAGLAGLGESCLGTNQTAVSSLNIGSPEHEPWTDLSGQDGSGSTKSPTVGVATDLLLTQHMLSKVLSVFEHHAHMCNDSSELR